MKKNNLFNAEEFIQNSLVSGCICGDCCGVCICGNGPSGSGDADAGGTRSADKGSSGMGPAKPIIAYDLRP